MSPHAFTCVSIASCRDCGACNAQISALVSGGGGARSVFIFETNVFTSCNRPFSRQLSSSWSKCEHPAQQTRLMGAWALRASNQVEVLSTCFSRWVPDSADNTRALASDRAEKRPSVLLSPDRFATMVFALASRTLRSPSYRSVTAQLAGARRGYAEAVGDKLRLSFVLPHKVCSGNAGTCC